MAGALGVVITTDVPMSGQHAQPVYVDESLPIVGPSRAVVVTSGEVPQMGGPAIPVRLAPTGTPAIGPALPVYVVSGSLGGVAPIDFPDTITRYAGNPIIPLGASGTWEDVDVANPDVFYDTANSRWVMNYSGYDGAVWLTGLAYSTDLLTWTKEAANPVITLAAGESAIAANGTIVKKGSTYYFYYQAVKAGTTKIYCRTSTDLLNWSVAFSGNPVINTDATEGTFTSDPAARLMPDGVTIEIFYNARAALIGGTPRAIWRATSTDGVNFTKQGMLMQSVGNNAQFGEPYPLGDTGASYDVWTDYSSTSLTGNPRRIMRWELVTGVWTDRGIILGPGTATWESIQVFDVCPIVSNGGLYIFYAGGPIAGGSENIGAQIGVATVQYPIPPVAPLTPNQVTGLTGWWDALTSSSLWQDTAGTVAAGVGDPVGRWDDLSGNGRHFIQATAGRRPTRQASNLLFNSASPNWLSCAAQAASALYSSTRNQWTAFFVITHDSTKADNTLLWHDVAGSIMNLYIPLGGTLYFDFGTAAGTGRANVIPPGSFENAIHILTFRRLITGTQTIFMDGVSLVDVSRSSVIVNLSATLLLGVSSALSSSLAYKGTVSALAMYDVGVSDQECRSVELYLRTRFGTP